MPNNEERESVSLITKVGVDEEFVYSFGLSSRLSEKRESMKNKEADSSSLVSRSYGPVHFISILFTNFFRSLITTASAQGVKQIRKSGVRINV